MVSGVVCISRVCGVKKIQRILPVAESPSKEEGAPELTATFQNVTTLGAGYLAATWLWFKLVFTQSNPKLVYAFATFGILLQFLFCSVFLAQRGERLSYLQLPAVKGPLCKDGGDVVLRVLNCLCCLVYGWLLILLAVAVIAALRPHAHFRGLKLP